MADLSEFDAVANDSSPGPRCSLCVTMNPAKKILNADQLESLRAALATDYRGGGYSHSVISKVLISWGHKISENTVGRHRRGLCRND